MTTGTSCQPLYASHSWIAPGGQRWWIDMCYFTFHLPALPPAFQLFFILFSHTWFKKKKKKHPRQEMSARRRRTHAYTTALMSLDLEWSGWFVKVNVHLWSLKVFSLCFQPNRLIKYKSFQCTIHITDVLPVVTNKWARCCTPISLVVVVLYNLSWWYD